jgi:hypothetical protein
MLLAELHIHISIQGLTIKIRILSYLHRKQSFKKVTGNIAPVCYKQPCKYTYKINAYRYTSKTRNT